MEYTGERIVEGMPDQVTWREHHARFSFIKHFVEKKRVWDNACGVGIGTKIYASVADYVVGTDICSDAVYHAVKTNCGENTEYKVVDSLAADLKQKFDVVVATEIIEHVEDGKKFLSVCKKHLKAGGMLILSAPVLGAKPYCKFHKHEYAVDEFKRLIGKAKYFYQNDTIIMEEERWNNGNPQYILCIKQEEKNGRDSNPELESNE